MRYSSVASLRKAWCVGLSLYAVSLFAAQEASPPFVGEVTGNRVNLRSGASPNYHVLKMTNKGDKLIVREVKKEWVKVDVPSDVFLYIAKEYAKTLGDGKGVVTGDRVNVRPTPDLKQPPLCQLNEKDQIRIVATVGEFYKIEPPAEAFAWVSSQYVRFVEPLEEATKKIRQAEAVKKEYEQLVAMDTEETKKDPSKRDLVALITRFDKFIDMTPQESEMRQLAVQRRTQLDEMKKLTDSMNEKIDKIAAGQETITKLEDKTKTLETMLVQLTTPPPPAPSYTAKGRVRSLDRVWHRPSTHKLVDDQGEILYLINSDRHNLNDFDGKRVGIIGKTSDVRGWRAKLIDVDEIDVIDDSATQ
jgi:hypothetical protein